MEKKNNNHDHRILILEELIKGSRQSNAGIAKKIGVSRQTVARVIKNLEKEKIIWGYVPVYNIESLNKKLFMLILKLSPTCSPKKTREIMLRNIDALTNDIQMVSTYFLHGQFEWVMIFTSDNIKTAKKVITKWILSVDAEIDDYYLEEVLLVLRRNSILNPDWKKEMDDWF